MPLDKAKKTLVRNTKGPALETKTKRDTDRQIAVVPKLNLRNKTPRRPGDIRNTIEDDSELDLRTPVLNSSKSVLDQINTLRKERDALDLKQRRNQMNELVTKKVNFPQDMAVYKNLIPLTITPAVSRAASVKSDALVSEDSQHAEPKLKFFLRPRAFDEFSHSSRDACSTDDTDHDYAGSRHYFNGALD